MWQLTQESQGQFDYRQAQNAPLPDGIGDVPDGTPQGYHYRHGVWWHVTRDCNGKPIRYDAGFMTVARIERALILL